MNPIQIIGLLQLALSLLANPQVQTNPTYKAQATSFAVMAVDLAEKAVAIQAASLIDIGAPTSDPVIPAPPPTLNCPSSVISVNQIPQGCSTTIQIVNKGQGYNPNQPNAESLKAEINNDNVQISLLQGEYDQAGCNNLKVVPPGLGVASIIYEQQSNICAPYLASTTIYSNDLTIVQQEFGTLQ